MAVERMPPTAWSPFALGARQQGLASKYGLASGGTLKMPRVIGLALAVTWLPLLVLTLIEGTALGDTVTIPFLGDHVANGRYLLALPLLLLMDQLVEHRTSLAVQRLRDARLIDDADEQAFERDMATAERLWRSPAVRWLLVVLTYCAAVTSFIVNRELDVSSWRFTGDPASASLSVAGVWDVFVAAALVRFLFLRAFWKLAIWAWLLTRLSRLRLRIDPLHADGRCGLMFLGATQLAFAPLVSALAVQFGCVVAVAARYQGIPPTSFRLAAAAFVSLSLMLILGPLFTFVRQTWPAQEQTANVFGAWATFAARHMSAHLFASQRDQVPGHLTTADISSITDASSLFDRVIATRPVPIHKRHVAAVLIAAVVPMLLPLLALVPLADILKRLAAILL